MAISNCLFSPKPEDTHGFSIRVVFAKLATYSRQTLFTNMLAANLYKRTTKQIKINECDKSGTN